MNWKPLFAGLLAAGLLSGCASNINAPATLPAVDPQPGCGNQRSHQRHRQFRPGAGSSHAPGATITLGEGVLKLDFGDDINTGIHTAGGKPLKDGFQLVISGVQDLTIQGAGGMPPAFRQIPALPTY